MPTKISDLRELSNNELEKKIRDSRQSLLDARLSKRTGQLEKTHTLKEVRRNIARMETVLTEKKKSAPAA